MTREEMLQRVPSTHRDRAAQLTTSELAELVRRLADDSPAVERQYGHMTFRPSRSK